MEHIIQFGLTIDDDKIEKLVTDKASDECLSQIRKSVKEFTGSSYYEESKLKSMFSEEVKRVVNDNKEEIIEKVVKQVSTNIMKTKDMMTAKAKLVDSLNS